MGLGGSRGPGGWTDILRPVLGDPKYRARARRSKHVPKRRLEFEPFFVWACGCAFNPGFVPCSEEHKAAVREVAPSLVS